MTNYFFLLFLFVPYLLFGQAGTQKVLVVPLSANHIRLSSLTEKTIRYNNASRDSILNYIVSAVNSKVILKNFSIVSSVDLPILRSFPDTVCELKKWNCFYKAGLDYSQVIMIKNNDQSVLESYHNNYYGYILTENWKSNFRIALADSKCDFILFINQFEIINPNSIMSLHVELYDATLNKIYGNKNEVAKSFSKTMYLDVLKYFIDDSVNDMLNKVDIYLSAHSLIKSK